MQRANSNKKKNGAPKAKMNIGDKRPRPPPAKTAPISYPVKGMKSKTDVTSRTRDGTRMCIVQPLSDISNVAASVNGNVLVSSTLGTVLTQMLPLCPSQLNGSVQAEGQIWTNYRILGIKFHYIPTCPTTTSGALCFGTSDSPATIAGTDINSFSTARSVRNAVTTSVYQPMSWSIKLNSDDSVLRICDTGAVPSGQLADKLAYNKVFFARTDQAAPAVTTISYGFVNIELDIEFTQLMTSQGFTLFASTMEEKLVLASIRDTLFPKRAPQCTITEPVDGVNFLLSRLGLKKDSDTASNSSVKSWVLGSR